MERIDFEKKQFSIKGKTYNIDTDVIGYERVIVYLDKLPAVTLGKSHLEIVKIFSAILQKLTKGDDSFKEAYIEAVNIANAAVNQLRGTETQDFLKANLDNILHFCALFCNAEDEDVSTYNEAAVNRKVELFKKHVNIWDFFLLSKILAPLYHEKLQALRPQKSEKSPKRTR